MKFLKVLLSAILAGMAIGIGSIAFLSLESKTVGALFFVVGLFTICTCGFNLFTGKVCYIFQNDKEYAFQLPVIWLGNFVGTGLMAGIVRLTRIESISAKALNMCQVKMEDSFFSLFLLGVCCNMLIYIAVDGFKNNPHELGKYLALFLE